MNWLSLKNVDRQHIADAAEKAGRVFDQGGLVVFPTETVYGIGASIASDAGYAALRAFKERGPEQPFTVHMAAPNEAQRYVDLANPTLRRLVSKVLPGPVTLIVQASDQTIAQAIEALGLPQAPDIVRQRLYHLDNTIGLRCPDDPIAQAVLAAAPGQPPIVAASANRRGQPPPQNAQAAAEGVGDNAQLGIDGGSTRYAKASTVIHVRPTPAGLDIQVNREGVLDERYIRKLLRVNLLLVCTGNTCRSPMAEAIARDLIATGQAPGLPAAAAADDDAAPVTVTSAGVYAAPGSPASAEAVQALAPLGIDLSQHRSRGLTVEAVNQADAIYCMTAGHRDALLSLAPYAASKTRLLDPQQRDIDDPIGQSLAVYQQCAQQIRQGLLARLQEQFS